VRLLHGLSHWPCDPRPLLSFDGRHCPKDGAGETISLIMLIFAGITACIDSAHPDFILIFSCCRVMLLLHLNLEQVHVDAWDSLDVSCVCVLVPI
jgi:hypothetical protein